MRVLRSAGRDANILAPTATTRGLRSTRASFRDRYDQARDGLFELVPRGSLRAGGRLGVLQRLGSWMHHSRAPFDRGKQLLSGYHQHKRLLELRYLDATAQSPHACRMIIRCGEDRTAVGAELCTSDPAVTVPLG
jgi:hypothetical protein